MGALQVYLPGGRGCDPQQLVAVGLADLLDSEVGVSAVDVLQDGPDGGGGVCFFWGTTGYGVHLDSQSWIPAKPSGSLTAGRFWLGWPTGQQPGPSDLERPKGLGGLPVKLDDGNEWTIPVARQVPHKFALDAAGSPVRVVKTRYAQFWQDALGYYEMFQRIGQGGGEITVAGGWSYAGQALAYNYRINADLIDALELISDECIVWLIGATLEISQIEAQKKTT